MNVLQLNTLATRGGAALACRRLHDALRASGHHSRIVSGQHVTGHPECHTWVAPSPLWRFVRLLCTGAEIKLGLEGLVDVASWVRYRRHAAWADCIHMHNLHSYYFSLLLLPRLERHAPLVWTLHDMWAATGHCAYPMACSRWQHGCGRCPNLPGPPRIDLDTTRLLYAARRYVYARVDPVLVTPSRWLLSVVRDAPLTRRFCSVCIPNGIDLDVFRPIDPHAARASLGLGGRERVILALANSMTRARKGRGLLARALALLSAAGHRDVRLVFIGGADRDIAAQVPFPCLLTGRVDSEPFMAALLSSADLFVLPTRADNLPNSLVESLACGTPCVSFRVGGVPEVVRPGRTGWLAPAEDAEGLARCIHEALSDAGRLAAMRGACRSVAEAEYDVRLMADRYLRLYAEVIRERRARRTDALDRPRRRT